MDSANYPVEASFPRPREAIMEERYRHLHYDPSAGPPFWAPSSSKALALGRLKRHLPAIPKKKGKDPKNLLEIPVYPKHFKDKYGSVSAHSTSAIYGALRAPHYHTIYGPSDLWYASVRSLNRGIHRDVVYTAEAYEWRETLYEDASTKEVFTVGPPVEMIPRPTCMCMLRRRHLHEASSVSKSSRIPRCKICMPAVTSNGSSNASQPLLKRPSAIPEKMKSLPAEKVEAKLESTSRMSGYKKCLSESKYRNSTFRGMSAKEARKISRKSILECGVTAYDLIKKVAKTPSVSEIEDSDIDDNLNDNAVSKSSSSKRLNYSDKPKKLMQDLSPNKEFSKLSYKRQSSTFKKSQSENCIYSESHSVLVGGQRIFTNNHNLTTPILSANLKAGDELGEMSRDAGCLNWKKMSASDESVCIPDPDYDFSDDSDDSTVINSNYLDPKFTYSPPPTRKSIGELYPGLGYGSRELSKSMSSLQSDDTYVPSINTSQPNSSKWKPELKGCDKYDTYLNDEESDVELQYDRGSPSPSNLLSSKQDSKYESSSDCSSSGGTMSSDYPTWTSSSSNELKSILKNKKRRGNCKPAQQDTSEVPDYFEDYKEFQRKKQVQFKSGFHNTAATAVNDHSNEEVLGNEMYLNEKVNSVINDTYETLDEAKSDKSISDDPTKEEHFKAATGAYGSVTYCSNMEGSTNLSSAHNMLISTTNTSNANFSLSTDGKQTSPCSSLPPKLLPCRSSSLEDIRSGNKGEKDIIGLEKDEGKRRTTLPKRRFSDLHLHMLLCPTKAFCGSSCNSDEAKTTQRAHRSLPDSPSALEELPSFCFDFLDKNSKDKILSTSRSVFYIPVDGGAQRADPQETSHSDSTPAVIVSPSGEEETNQCVRPAQEPALGRNFFPEQNDLEKENVENDYENLDPIYEELSEITNSLNRQLSTDSEPKSFFEGASKTDILSYLEDAKERGLSTEGLSEDEKVILEEEDEDEKILSDEDTGEKNRVLTNNSINYHKEVLLKIEEDIEDEQNLDSESTVAAVPKSSRVSEVERNDSGVGTETSKPSRMKVLSSDWEEQLCADCDHQVEPVEDEDSGLLFNPLVCHKCEFRRSERKEIIIEFVDTEFKYGRDLRIIKEEFYRPMEIAGLLAKDQLLSIFLNLDELTAVNTKFSEKLQDALDIAMEHGDEDYTTVNIGKIFLETSSMLHAFETYCVKQASASILLSNLEKEKELLRIFLRVSQMENTLLRRMNLPAFLMVPVQRVTRYPLLLSRLHKVTPIHHKDRNALKEAQQKVELHLEHINQQTKGVGGTKIWRRISNISTSHRRLGKDIGSIKLRKMALEVLDWKQDEARFVIAGKLLFTPITDYPWNKKGKTVKFTSMHALLITLGKPNSNYRPESVASDNVTLFPRNTGIRDASLVLMKEKNGRFIIIREPLYLGNCVISCEADIEDVFEIQEYTTKDAYLLKGETKTDTKEWLRQLRYHAKDLGTWRKRRNALANIMINGMIRQ